MLRYTNFRLMFIHLNILPNTVPGLMGLCWGIWSAFDIKKTVQIFAWLFVKCFVVTKN